MSKLPLLLFHVPPRASFLFSQLFFFFFFLFYCCTLHCTYLPRCFSLPIVIPYIGIHGFIPGNHWIKNLHETKPMLKLYHKFYLKLTWETIDFTIKFFRILATFFYVSISVVIFKFSPGILSLFLNFFF